MSQQVKALTMQAWQSEFHPGNLCRGGRWEQTKGFSDLRAMCCGRHAHICTYAYTYTLVIHLKNSVRGFPLEMELWFIKAMAKIVNMP